MGLPLGPLGAPQDCAPSCSGRLAGYPAPGAHWGRCQRRVRVTCQHGFPAPPKLRSGGVAAGPAGASTRAGAYSGSLPLGGAGYAGATVTAEPAQQQLEEGTAAQQQQQQQQPGNEPALDPLTGAPLGGANSRAKPLKINMDLALVRA